MKTIFLLLLLANFLGQEGPADFDSPLRLKQWEIDLLPGSFRVKTEKMPAPDPEAQSDLYYLAVAYHTPDNVQYVLYHGWKKIYSTSWQGPVPHAETKIVEISEAHKVKGALSQPERILAQDTVDFTFTLRDKTRVFFTAHRITQRQIPRTVAGQKLSWLPPNWPLRNTTAREDFQCPFLLRWLPAREIFQMEMECERGHRQFRDWIVSVDYLE